MSNNGYIGRAPSDSSVVVARETFYPSGVQTNFTFASNYDIGYLDVYLNGSRLIDAADYQATDGSTVGLTTYAESGDALELVAYKTFSVNNVTNANGNFAVAGTLGVTGVSTVGILTVYGTLDVEGVTTLGAGTSVAFATTSYGLAGTPNISVAAVTAANGANITGIVTATTFVGALTGNVTGNASGSSGSCTGNAAGLTGTPSITVQDITAEMVSIGGTLTYEDVTNIDSVGLITARKGIIVSGVSTFLGSQEGINVSGVSTFSGAQQGINVISGVTTSSISGNITGTAATVGSAVTITGSGIDIHAGAGITAGSIGKASFTTLYGDGSNLTGIAATDNIITGTAATFNNSVNFNAPVALNNGGTMAGVYTGGNFSGVVTATSFSGSLAASSLTGTITASEITVADESSDTSCNVVFVTAATGDLEPKTGTNLTFDSDTGKLTCDKIDAAGNVPGPSQSGTVTLAASDAGKFVSAGSGGVTVAASILAAGEGVTIYNSHTGDITLTCSAPSNVYLGTDGSAKTSITLATKCVCTFFCVDAASSGTYVCIGGGIS